tara:strand:- start:558 stop:1088 length:531 start_codon:yes stop_codon:yes gene_type:complete
MMNKKIFGILIITFFICIVSLTKVYAMTVFIDMDHIMNNSLAGKSIGDQLKKTHQKNLDNFKKEEESLKEKETKIIAQKNVLDKNEYQKKISLLRKEVSEYRDMRNKMINGLTQKRLEAQSLLIKTLNPILADYSEKNSISIILQKKNVIIGKSELDITKEILKLLDADIKKIKIK